MIYKILFNIIITILYVEHCIIFFNTLMQFVFTKIAPLKFTAIVKTIISTTFLVLYHLSVFILFKRMPKTLKELLNFHEKFNSQPTLNPNLICNSKLNSIDVVPIQDEVSSVDPNTVYTLINDINLSIILVVSFFLLTMYIESK